MTTLLNFLTHLFEQGKAYSTLNTYRFAVSATLGACGGSNVGSHSVVTRFMKRVFVSKPPRPKYSSTWDASMVTSCLETFASLGLLSLKDLTLKTVSHVALVSACGCQSIHLVDMNYMSVSDNQIVFVIQERVKTSRPGRTESSNCFIMHIPELSSALTKLIKLLVSVLGVTSACILSVGMTSILHI